MKVGYLAAEFERKNEKTKPSLRRRARRPAQSRREARAHAAARFPLQAIDIVLDAEAAAAFDDLTRSRRPRHSFPARHPSTGPTSSAPPASFRRSNTFARSAPAPSTCRSSTTLMSRLGRLRLPHQQPSLTATNLTGHPQVVVPCGFVDGLPQGLLFTSRFFEEGTAMRLAYAYEQATDWHTKHPALQT